MRGVTWGRTFFGVCGLAMALMAHPASTMAQSEAGAASASSPRPSSVPSDAAHPADLSSVQTLLQQLQRQVQDLSDQVKSLKSQQDSQKAESAELRRELEAAKSPAIYASSASSGTASTTATNTPESAATTAASPASDSSSSSADIEHRVVKLEENQQMQDGKIADQSQTKVESGSKYRLRLSGMILMNTYVNRGGVDNQDFPQLAVPPGILDTNGSFGASLRQSDLRIQGFGPEIAGAKTSADVEFDFAGGFPETSNGTSFGIVRLKTATIRFDWENTSLIAGQDTLFFAPLSPTSIATVAVPALAYSGNLWGWIPQVRVEHRFAVSDSSSVLLQAGLLDSYSGDTPPAEFNRYPTWGENSGQPAYATRISWTKSLNGQNLTIGAGGYYGRQEWGFNRTVNGWAATADVTVPFGRHVEFTGQFYRGNATGGFGGGIGQDALWNGSLVDPETPVYGLNSMGGWAQLKIKATSKLQFNGAFGQDNPFAADLRELGGSQAYYATPLARNQSAMVNFLYQPRSNVVFSLEYRRLKTSPLDADASIANIVIASVGYIF